jgi:hypothetical protein
MAETTSSVVSAYSESSEISILALRLIKKTAAKRKKRAPMRPISGFGPALKGRRGITQMIIAI